jgi:ParB family transcriptional regulator, chromosome partitioning protein
MSRKDERAQLLAVTPQPAGTSPEEKLGAKPRVGSPALRSMGLSMDRFRAEATEEARSLKLALEAGNSVVELDTSLVDPSFIRDRLSLSEDPEFEVFKDSIKTHGQKVPILVRPNPRTEGRYEAAYGHRRLLACAQLGKKVRAVISQIDDIELVIAQGKENCDRLDPSYIERAMYAHALAQHPFDRAVILDALSVDKGTLSRLLKLASAVPIEIATAIGPARKAGRPRWSAFVSRLEESTDGTGIMSRAIAEPRFQQADSDARFTLIFDALAPKPKPNNGNLDQSATVADLPMRTWTSKQGKKLARIEQSDAATMLTFDETVAPQFGAFLIGRLQTLYDEFEATLADASRHDPNK